MFFYSLVNTSPKKLFSLTMCELTIVYFKGAKFFLVGKKIKIFEPYQGRILFKNLRKFSSWITPTQT